MKIVFISDVHGVPSTLLGAPAVSTSASAVKSGSVTCERFNPGTHYEFQCWASDGLKDGEGVGRTFNCNSDNERRV